jgi:dolichol-phosphate mannosyltransferase
MPAWNEASVIERVVAEIQREIGRVVPAFELVIVDDHSSDGTGEILDRIAEQDGRINLEHSEHNRGHGPSVAHAIDSSAGEWIFQLDSDGQIPVDQFRRLWELRGDADLVIGVRVARSDPRHRLVLSWLIARVVSRLAGSSIRDANAPFKLFRRSVWDDVRAVLPSEPLAPSLALALAAAKRGRRTKTVPVHCLPTTHRPSSLRAIRLAIFSLRGLRELLAINRKLAR